VVDVVCLQHAEHEGAGILGTLLAEMRLVVQTIHLYRGELLPDPRHARLWVVLGGPFSVSLIGDPRYPFLATEAAAVASRLRTGLPLLGICFGSQIIAHAAGARVYPNVQQLQLQEYRPDAPLTPVLEVGWAPIRLLGHDREPAFTGLQSEEVVLHWHGETYDLPSGAVHLASSSRCRHQAFRLGHQVYAVQFHPEVRPSQVEAWIQADGAFLRQARGPDGPRLLRQEAHTIAEASMARCQLLLRGMLTAMGIARG
jgi:GMP synthase (glutamine-hydrolysing)